MVYLLNEEIDLEIETAFSCDSTVTCGGGDDILKGLLKNHKKLTIKFLNRKWDISSLKSHIENKIIPRGLRERVIPAGHLHTPRFLELWKQSCLEWGLAILNMIVEEEQIQLEEIKKEIDNSVQLLEPYKLDPILIKTNELLKKEVEKTQKLLKSTKQEKFKQNLQDWENGDIFDPTIPRGRSRSRRRNRRNRSKIAQPRHSSTDGEAGSSERTVAFLEVKGDIPNSNCRKGQTKMTPTGRLPLRTISEAKEEKEK